jgi:hypothetical protein
MLPKGIHPNPKPATCQSIQDCGSAFRKMGRYILLRSFTPTECWWDSIRTPQLRRLCSLGLLLCLDGILDNRRQVYVLLCTSFKRVEYIRGDDSLLTPAWVDSLPLGLLKNLISQWMLLPYHGFQNSWSTARLLKGAESYFRPETQP